MANKFIYKEKNYLCPLELAMDIVGGKWKTIIVYYLRHGAMRSGELQKKMPKVTNKIYTQSLRELEANDIIIRTVYPVVPPKVEYSLTEKGMQLVPILKELVKWGFLFVEDPNQD